jgi:hypothetical protein
LGHVHFPLSCYRIAEESDLSAASRERALVGGGQRRLPFAARALASKTPAPPLTSQHTHHAYAPLNETTFTLSPTKGEAFSQTFLRRSERGFSLFSLFFFFSLSHAPRESYRAPLPRERKGGSRSSTTTASTQSNQTQTTRSNHGRGGRGVQPLLQALDALRALCAGGRVPGQRGDRQGRQHGVGVEQPRGEWFFGAWRARGKREKEQRASGGGGASLSLDRLGSSLSSFFWLTTSPLPFNQKPQKLFKDMPIPEATE